MREEPLYLRTLCDALASRLAHKESEWEPEALLQVATEIIGEASELSVTLVGAAGQRLSWREDAAAALRELRRHPRPFVRAMARTLVTAQK